MKQRAIARRISRIALDRLRGVVAAAVAVVVACVEAACVCALLLLQHFYIEHVKQRAITRRIATIALDQR